MLLNKKRITFTSFNHSTQLKTKHFFLTTKINRKTAIKETTLIWKPKYNRKLKS